MEARKQIVDENRSRHEEALRHLVRLLARQAAAEFVRDRLPDGSASR